VEAAYFQCARAILRAALWDPKSHIKPDTLPTPGRILSDLGSSTVNAAEYDRAQPDNLKRTLY
jgi:hypothetical protein